MPIYQPVIGLEIHIQLKTASKMFCPCPNLGGDADPNTAVCPVCMGHPGTLPTINQEAVRQGIRMALALNCTIAQVTRFDRKQYFYPDLPKGYQISQFDNPIATRGHVRLPVPEERSINIERLHLEEDAGKNFHVNKESLVDFNRAGVPLAEIVTKPDFRSPEEARMFLQELRLIARYLGISDADMEKGHLRCDANISLRPQGDDALYPKTEIKNLNSFRAVERALMYEISRQTKLWDAGTPPVQQETRGWNDGKGETVPQRTKEGSDDYRYFPEPDLRPVQIRQAEVDSLYQSLPELPQAKRDRLMQEFGLSWEEVSVLTANKEAADYFERTASELRAWVFDLEQGSAAEKEKAWERDKSKLAKFAHSWITSELFKHVNADGTAIQDSRVAPEDMAELIGLIVEGKVNSTAAQQILETMYRTGDDPHAIAERESLFQTNDTDELLVYVRQVISQFPDQVAQFKGGKEAVLQFLVGQVMRLSKGKANPQMIADLLRQELTNN